MDCRARSRLARLPWVGILLLASCAETSPPPNLLLVVVDTLRQDRVSAYGAERVTTPNLDRLAERSYLFTHAQTPRAKTTPAMTSLMTGLYPHDHGVRDLSKPFDGKARTLAEHLGRNGFETAGIIGNYVLTRDRAGLHLGFDTWIEDLPQRIGVPPDDVPQRTATSLTDAALETAGSFDAERPWFLYLHYMDPHGLYAPPEEHDRFESAAPDPIPDEVPEHPIHKRRVAEYNVPDEARLADGRADAARVRDLYDGEVHYADAQIGRLLADLEERGLLENTIVVVTSDHGESLGEHAYWFEHGFYAYEATCRVPLILDVPDPDAPEPGIRHGDISLVDLAPTLLDLMGLPPLTNGDLLAPSAPRGLSRADLLRRDDDWGHPVFSEKIERADLSRTIQGKAVRMGDWKLIRRYFKEYEPGRPEEGRMIVLSEELYDLAADPGEQHNLIDAPPPEAHLERLQVELIRFAQADVRFADLAQELQRNREALEREDPEALDLLEKLGY